jgi:hypothetical protein
MGSRRKSGPGPISRLAWLSLLALCAGCVSNYRDPSLDEAASEPTARLILKSRDGIVAFRAFDESTRCREARAIGGATALQAGEDDEADIGVPAGRDFSFGAQQVLKEGKAGCKVLATFKPESGKRYLATFRADGATCSLDFMRILSAVPPRAAAEPTFRVRRASTETRDAACAAE